LGFLFTFHVWEKAVDSSVAFTFKILDGSESDFRRLPPKGWANVPQFFQRICTRSAVKIKHPTEQRQFLLSRNYFFVRSDIQDFTSFEFHSPRDLLKRLQ
jgi:hypothetical protein